MDNYHKRIPKTMCVEQMLTGSSGKLKEKGTERVHAREWYILYQLLPSFSFFSLSSEGSAPPLPLHWYSAFRQKYLSSPLLVYFHPPPFPPQRKEIWHHRVHHVIHPQNALQWWMGPTFDAHTSLCVTLYKPDDWEWRKQGTVSHGTVIVCSVFR